MCFRGLGDVYFFFQAEDGIRDHPRSRGLGNVYKSQDKSLGVLKSGQAGANDEAIKTFRMGDVLIFYLGGKSRFSRSRKIAVVL